MLERQDIEAAIPDHVVVHLRTVMVFAEQAGRYRSDVRVAAGTQEVNGKDVMDLLTLLGAGHRRLRISAAGPDAAAATTALKQLVESGFGE